MNLIIEIPEKVVTAIQNGEDYRYDIHTAIAQGIPYEELKEGDLISHKALKKNIDFEHICKRCHNNCGLVWDICPIAEIRGKIDNAPTVERPQENCISEQSGFCSPIGNNGLTPV